MTPLFTCKGCGHPAIKAAKKCKTAMELANANQHKEATAMLRTALSDLRQSPLPLMQAKIFNSLGIVYAQQNRAILAKRCFNVSLRIVEKHVGTNNWLHSRITGNRDSLPVSS